jgi:hypothetical protein
MDILFDHTVKTQIDRSFQMVEVNIVLLFI